MVVNEECIEEFPRAFKKVAGIIETCFQEFLRRFQDSFRDFQGSLRSSKNLEIIKKVSEATGKVLRVSEDVTVIQGSS